MKRARRILLTADTVGGVWNYTVEMAQLLEEMECEVAIAAMGSHPDPQQIHELSRLSNTTLFESSYKLEWMESPWDEVFEAGKWLKNIQKDFKADIVHLNQYAFGQINFGCPVLVVGHSCVYSWHEAVKKDGSPAKNG